MTSSGPDRSITGLRLPQWMKSKINDRYDLEQTPFSPPNTDDGFFLIKYKKAAPEQPEPPKITVPKLAPPIKQNFEINQPTEVSQLTDAYKNYVPNAPREIGMRQSVDSSLSRIKSTGTDDGFKSEAGSCGYSVVAVAHQMIAERTGDKKRAAPQMNQRTRRNSKSLPASPQTSPKLLRKNPYFTNIIFGSSEVVDNEIHGSVEELGKYKLRAAIDGNSNNDISSQKPSSLARQLFTPSPPTPAPSGFGQSLVSLKAKPSHLREMNFWSPTSM